MAGWNRVCDSFLIILFVSLAVSAAFAQESSANFNGTVLDQSGAPIEGAIITVKELSTGQVRSTKTEGGAYSLPLLSVGVYTLTCSHPGFTTQIRSNVTVTVGQLATVDFSLKVGETNQSVEVSSAAEQLNTTNGELGQVLNEKDIVELPLNGRNPATLVFLTPGAVDGLKGQVFTRQTFTTFPSETGSSSNGGRQGS